MLTYHNQNVADLTSIPDKPLWYKCNSCLSYFRANKKPIFSFRLRLENQVLLKIEELKGLKCSKPWR